MTVSPSQGQEPAGWFLQMLGGKSTIRITSGLLLGEDARGDFEIGPGDSPLLRFEIDDGALWICVVSRDWTLSSRERMLGDSVRITGAVALRLPNNDFRVLGGQAPEVTAQEIQLTRRQSLNWLRPTPEAGEAEGDGGSTSRERAPVEDVRVEDSAAEDPPADVEQPEQSGAADSIAAFFADRPVSGPRPFITDETVESRTSKHRPRPASEDHLSVPARAPRHRRAVGSGPSWPVTLAALALYLAGLVFSTPVQTPVLQEPGSTGGGAEQVEEDAFLAKVEELLRQQSPPDPTTLGFAVEAYRAASARRPADENLRRRLAELESAMR